MITIKNFEDDPSHYIYGDDCRLTVDSMFEREFAGNLQLLVDCCADNARPDGINYYKAIRDYVEIEGVVLKKFLLKKNNANFTAEAKCPFIKLDGANRCTQAFCPGWSSDNQDCLTKGIIKVELVRE